MAIKAHIWLEPFNRDADFIVTRQFLCNAEEQLPGMAFNKAMVSTRTLRQLYDLRKLRIATPEEVSASKVVRDPGPGKVTRNRKVAPHYDKDGSRLTVKREKDGRYAVYRGARKISRSFSNKEDARRFKHDNTAK